ncbi:MAG: hypothetical protein IJ631_03760 [Schwartzia sp.]|nr:hypothetical protein [Schwartzia sp. (in: firmicutes)]
MGANPGKRVRIAGLGLALGGVWHCNLNLTLCREISADRKNVKLQKKLRLLPASFFCYENLGLVMNTNFLYDAAIAFEVLLRQEYHIVLGRRQQIWDVVLQFHPDNFYHLAGLQKLSSAYGFQRMRYAQVFREILKANISDETICADAMFPAIIPRMCALSEMESILDNPKTLFFGYDRKKAVINSNITADYVAKGSIAGQPVILAFFVRDASVGKYCVKSVFPMENYDYSKGQIQYTLLLSEKRNLKSNETVQLFSHHKYTV